VAINLNDFLVEVRNIPKIEPREKAIIQAKIDIRMVQPNAEIIHPRYGSRNKMPQSQL
jgi:S-ribosylhomocysteine lyase LuxS involved in autoinducer biosynthesis